MKTRLLYLLLFICCFSSVMAQVSNVKNNIKNDQSSSVGVISSSSHSVTSSSSSSSSSSFSSSSSSFSSRQQSFGDYIAVEILTGIIRGVGLVTVQAQKSVLANREKYPNLISFETGLEYGTSLKEHLFQPGLRVNWGIIGSDLRYSWLNDKTGTLKSIDWQVLILRVPFKSIKLNYGVGFTSVRYPKTTYFESSTGFDLSLFESKLKIKANYRWTEKRIKNRYRQECKFVADYEVYRKGAFRISPLVGVGYQNYFHQDEFLFFNTGLKIRFSGN